ncbi:MAG: ArnT family glycosyltransferase [Anaerolineae bacterium]
MHHSGHPHAWRWVAVCGVLYIAWLVRFYGLADHPPGIWFDPAYNGLDALRLMQRGGHTFFFPTNGGRESLFVYLLIPSIWIFGATPFAMRLVTALMGVLHVALLFGLMYDLPFLLPEAVPLVRHMRRLRLWLAVNGSLVLATSYWHLGVSQRAERPIMAPLLSVPLFWFFLKGWYTGRHKWFVLAGVMLGLGAYTYGAARLLPVILVLAILPDLVRAALRGRASSQVSCLRAQCLNLGWLALSALLVALPMIGYFATHPGQFSARAESVTIWHYVYDPLQIAVEMLQNVPRVFGYFCCLGGTTMFNGLPDYPGVTPLLAPFLAAGFFGAAWHSHHLVHRLIWLWWLIGLTPSIVTIEAPHPLRMLVAITPTAIMIALAPAYLIGGLERLYTAPKLTCWLPGFITLLALASLPATWQAHFVKWAGAPNTRHANDIAALSIRDAVLTHTAAGATVYLPMSRLKDAPLLYYLGGTYDREATLQLPPAEGEVLVIAPDRMSTDTTWIRVAEQRITILPPLNEMGQQIIQNGLNSTAAIPLHTPDGDTAAWVAPLETDPVSFVQLPTQQINLLFGPMRLTGITYPTTIDLSGAEQVLPVTCYWQAAAPMRDEYEVLLHLVDDRRRAWGNGDARPTDWVYPTTFWRPGLDIVAAQHTVTLQAETLPPPGRYWLAIAVYDPAIGHRLPLTGETNGILDTYLVGPLKVPLPAPDETLWQRALKPNVRFGDMARLVGFAIDTWTGRSGEELTFTLIWQAISTPAVDYTVFVHLLDTQGQLVAGNDSQPVANTYPTTIWSPGELITDVRSIRLADHTGQALPADDYRLAIGLYNLSTNERLPVYQPDERSTEADAWMPPALIHIVP